MTRLPRAVSSRSARLTLSAHLALRTLLRRAARIATSTTLSRRRRKPALGNLSTRTLVIVVFLATIGLARGHQARAQGEGALVVAIVTMTDDQISIICTRNGEVDQACFKTYKKTQAFLGAFAGGIKGARRCHPVISAEAAQKQAIALQRSPQPLNQAFLLCRFWEIGSPLSVGFPTRPPQPM